VAVGSLGGGNSRYTIYRREFGGTVLEQVAQGALATSGNTGIFAIGSGTNPGTPSRLLDFQADEVHLSGIARHVSILDSNSTVQVFAGQGSFQSGTWNVGTLPPGATATLSIGVGVDPGTGGQGITNVAAIPATAQPDPDPSGHVASAAVYVVPDLQDTDGDGMPDSWEELHFGGATNGIASADVDGDDADNLSEFMADTIPTNALSVLLIGEVFIDNAVNILFESSIGRMYTLQGGDLENGSWSNISGNVNRPGVGGPDSFIDSPAPSNGTYRLEVLHP